MRDALPAIHAAIGIYVEASAPAERTAAIGNVLEVFAKVAACTRDFGEVEYHIHADIFIDYLGCTGSRGGVFGNGVSVVARLEVFKGVLPGFIFRSIELYHGIAHSIASNIGDIEGKRVGNIRNLAEEESGVGTGEVGRHIIVRIIGCELAESTQRSDLAKIVASQKPSGFVHRRINGFVLANQENHQVASRVIELFRKVELDLHVFSLRESLFTPEHGGETIPRHQVESEVLVYIEARRVRLPYHHSHIGGEFLHESAFEGNGIDFPLGEVQFFREEEVLRTETIRGETYRMISLVFPLPHFDSYAAFQDFHIQGVRNVVGEVCIPFQFHFGENPESPGGLRRPGQLEGLLGGGLQFGTVYRTKLVTLGILQLHGIIALGRAAVIQHVHRIEALHAQGWIGRSGKRTGNHQVVFEDFRRSSHAEVVHVEAGSTQLRVAVDAELDHAALVLVGVRQRYPFQGVGGRGLVVRVSHRVHHGPGGSVVGGYLQGCGQTVGGRIANHARGLEIVFHNGIVAHVESLGGEPALVAVGALGVNGLAAVHAPVGVDRERALALCPAIRKGGSQDAQGFEILKIPVP